MIKVLRSDVRVVSRRQTTKNQAKIRHRNGSTFFKPHVHLSAARRVLRDTLQIRQSWNIGHGALRAADRSRTQSYSDDRVQLLLAPASGAVLELEATLSFHRLTSIPSASP